MISLTTDKKIELQMPNWDLEKKKLFKKFMELIKYNFLDCKNERR